MICCSFETTVQFISPEHMQADGDHSRHTKLGELPFENLSSKNSTGWVINVPEIIGPLGRRRNFEVNILGPCSGINQVFDQHPDGNTDEGVHRLLL